MIEGWYQYVVRWHGYEAPLYGNRQYTSSLPAICLRKSNENRRKLYSAFIEAICGIPSSLEDLFMSRFLQVLRACLRSIKAFRVEIRAKYQVNSFCLRLPVGIFSFDLIEVMKINIRQSFDLCFCQAGRTINYFQLGFLTS